MLNIESSHWRLWSEPETGVQWVAAQVKRGEQWVDVVPDCRPTVNGTAAARAGQSETAPLAAANFHMIPYSNRIREGRFEFQGEHIQLENASSHAIHGALRKLPWTVTVNEPQRTVCEFDTHTMNTINWPWPLHASIEQRVDGDLLSSEISITNRGESSMPAGTGWHPYFVRSIDGSMPSLTLPASAVFPDANGDCLPDGPAIELPPSLDFRQTKELSPDQRIDACLANLDGNCHIHWRKAGIELVMTPDKACRFLILYNPDQPYFAVEPVTNANDAFNLDKLGIDSGTKVLEPGQTLTVSMHIRVAFHDT